MVARINTGKSISKALNYNEQKLKKGMAEILCESGFTKDVDKLTFYDKIRQFERYTSLNERATTNTLHVSLNFDPSEIIANEKIVAIAQDYMQRIGFGKQPYLIYRHHDAGHPHIHIVSTNIRQNGDRMPMHNLGRIQSEKARKEIEVEFNLVKAESKKALDLLNLVPVNAQKVIYGKAETKRAIANVLMLVLNRYKYSSLPELNAVLGLYNISADSGGEGSLLNRYRGLVYRVLDESGNKVGTPIKASAFHMMPTLAFLEKKFSSNENDKSAYRKKLQSSIRWVLNKQPISLDHFMKLLATENIGAVLRKGSNEVMYGITYVDHKRRCVFNGSDLGKQYSAKAVVESCREKSVTKEGAVNIRALYKGHSHPQIVEKSESKNAATNHALTLLEISAPEVPVMENFLPWQLRKRKKRKKKRLSI